MRAICKTCGHTMMYIARKGTKLSDYPCGQCGGAFRRASGEEHVIARKALLASMTPVPGLNEAADHEA